MTPTERANASAKQIEDAIIERYPILKQVRYVDTYFYLKQKGISTHRQVAFRNSLKRQFKGNPNLKFFIDCLEGNV